MLILNSTKEKSYTGFPHFWVTQSSQATPFAELMKPAYAWRPTCLLEYTIHANSALIEEDGVLFYVEIHQVTARLIIYYTVLGFMAIPVGRGFKTSPI